MDLIFIEYGKFEEGIELPYPFERFRGKIISREEFINNPNGKLIGAIVDGNFFLSWDTISAGGRYALPIIPPHPVELCRFNLFGANHYEYYDSVEEALSHISIQPYSTEQDIFDLADAHNELAKQGIGEDELQEGSDDIPVVSEID